MHRQSHIPLMFDQDWLHSCVMHCRNIRKYPSNIIMHIYIIYTYAKYCTVPKVYIVHRTSTRLPIEASTSNARELQLYGPVKFGIVNESKLRPDKRGPQAIAIKPGNVGGHDESLLRPGDKGGPQAIATWPSKVGGHTDALLRPVDKCGQQARAM